MATGNTTGSSGSGSAQSDSFVIKFLDPRNGLACVSGLPLKLTRKGLESYGANIVFNAALNPVGAGKAGPSSSGGEACKPHQVEVNFDGGPSGGYEPGNAGPTSGGQVPGLITIATDLFTQSACLSNHQATLHLDLCTYFRERELRCG